LNVWQKKLTALWWFTFIISSLFAQLNLAAFMICSKTGGMCD
jgi:hypothetical protein